MNEQEKNLLEQTYKLTKENNEMLHKVYRGQRRALVFRVVYWIIILGFFYGAYVYVEPYIKKVITVYSSTNQSLQNIAFPELHQLNILFNNSAKKVNEGN